MAKIWVYAERNSQGKTDPTTLELLTKARSLGGEVEAVALGPGATDSAADLAKYGAATVYASDDSVYDEFVAQPHAHALAELIGQHSPEVIMFPMSYDSRDI